jgi:hypothetical protein
MFKTIVLLTIPRPKSTVHNVNRYSDFQDTEGLVRLHTWNVAGTFQYKSGKSKQPQ